MRSYAMRQMLSCWAKRLRKLLVLATVITPLVSSGQSNGLTAQIKPLLIARYAAIARGDTAALRPLLATDLEWIGIANGGTPLSRAQLLNLAAQPQVPTPTYEIDSLSARRIGDIAIVAYRRSDHRQVGSAKQTLVVRAEEVLVRRGGTWLLELHTQSWVAAPVKPIALDSASLAAFVGHYQIAPGFADDVHWEGHQLVATATGEKTGAHLIPVSTAAFSPDGIAPLIVFERDSTGRVIGYVQGFPDGEVRRATRLP
ncbi:MAG TPA: nuclear transport factor 2 family protein [Gemmatimonadaceae bacterium]|jgi:hypothetical protein